MGAILGAGRLLLRLVGPALLLLGDLRGLYRERGRGLPLALERGSTPPSGADAAYSRARPTLRSSRRGPGPAPGPWSRSGTARPSRRGRSRAARGVEHGGGLAHARNGDLDRARAEWLRVMAVAGEIGDRSRQASRAVNLAAIACKSQASPSRRI